MFSTPLICCSSGVATVRDTVSAEAPGYCVVICTVGGTISGYCEMGRMASAPSPISVRKTLSTVAKIGLSMKVWVMLWSLMRLEVHLSPAGRGGRSACPSLLTSYSALPVGAGVEFDGAVLRRDLAAGNRAHQAVDDDAVARFETGLDHAQAAAQLAGGHDLRLHRSVSGNRHHQPLRLVGHDRGIRQEIHGRGRRDRYPQPRELARRQEQVGVRHSGARVNGAAGAIERIVDEVERALARKLALVGKGDQHLVGERARVARALAREGEKVGFAHVEIEIERIEG